VEEVLQQGHHHGFSTTMQEHSVLMISSRVIHQRLIQIFSAHIQMEEVQSLILDLKHFKILVQDFLEQLSHGAMT
jgi:predicted transcriptional regulator